MSVFCTICYYSHCSHPSLDICRYEAGLQKLLAAEGEVNVMKEELIQLQPKLIATGKQVEETLVVVNSQTEAAVAQKAVVSAEEAAASETAAAAKAIKVCTSCWQHTLMFLNNRLCMIALVRFRKVVSSGCMQSAKHCRLYLYPA